MHMVTSARAGVATCERARACVRQCARACVVARYPCEVFCVALLFALGDEAAACLK